MRRAGSKQVGDEGERSAALMHLALAEARRAEGRTHPNPMVGCVVARDGEVIAVGYHARAGAAHAEVQALEAAGRAARGADLYVTLEPCNHYGRTPPCTDAIIAAGVRRVFAGVRDENPIVNGKGIKRLRAAGIEVQVGLLGDECRELNRAFTHFIHSGKPYVLLKVAQSLDGRAATRTGESKWITGELARRAGHRLRDRCDAVIVGVRTVLADDPALTCRVRGGRDPLRVIVDSRARTPLRAQVMRLADTSPAPTLIAVGPSAPARRVSALASAGALVVRCRGRAGRVDLADLLVRLGELELLSVLVEGGPTLAAGFVEQGLVDEVHAFVAPMLIGGTAALASVGGRGVSSLAEALRLRELRYEPLGPDVHLWGRVGTPKF